MIVPGSLTLDRIMCNDFLFIITNKKESLIDSILNYQCRRFCLPSSCAKTPRNTQEWFADTRTMRKPPWPNFQCGSGTVYIFSCLYWVLCNTGVGEKPPVFVLPPLKPIQM